MKKFLLSLAAVAMTVVSMSAAKVYFDPTDTGWGTCTAHAWTGSDQTDVELQKVTVNGHELFMFNSDRYENIIFLKTKNVWNGDNVRTCNLTIEDGAVYGYAQLSSGDTGNTNIVAEVIGNKYCKAYYVRGGQNDWNVNKNFRLKTTDGITYSITKEGMTTQEFKIANQYGKDGEWLGHAGTNLADGTYNLSFESAGGNMSLNQGGLVSLTLSFAESTPTLTIEGQGEGTGVFFVGTRTSWDLERNCKMDKQDDGSYSLTIEDAHPDYEFKIVVVENNNKHWFSNDEQNIKNGTYTISGSGNTNMSLDEGGALVTFNVKPSDDFSSIVLTISGQGESTAPAKIYLISEATGWTADELYRFKTTDNVNYELYVENMTANVNFKILSQDEHNHMFTVDNTSNANPSELGDGNYNMVAIDAANTTNPEYNMSLGDNGNVTFKFALADDHNSATLNISGLTQNPEDKYARVYLVSEHRTGNVTSEDYMLHTTDGITCLSLFRI